MPPPVHRGDWRVLILAKYFLFLFTVLYKGQYRITVTLHGDDAANNAKLLVNLEGVADEDRTARFMSVVALIDTDGLVTYGEGACEGVIAHEGRGDHGFGYDPLFLPVDTPGKTMAELTADEKNAISHRFHALEHLSAKLTGEE